MTVVVRLEDSIVCLKVRVCEGSEGIRRRNERRERSGDHLTYTIAPSMRTAGSPHYNDLRCKAGEVKGSMLRFLGSMPSP
jgi:hypothetical protein